ncbi:hypothetical protein [Flavobacterium sp. MK4S-17]|uniref:hypothetical protein n=1 Tax=Flavobacterium sp. MK4S-17 TaxID=2543737 RepID=UPI00135C1BD1|nr:hypothetical protein [Flavobacterium sp. MK4S-17]
MIEIKLGTIAQTDRGAYIELDKEISSSEHEKLLKAISELHFYESNLRLLEMIILNNNELTDLANTGKDLVHNSLSFTGDKRAYYVHHLNMNRKFLNYLSSIRSFLDHIETNTKRRYGKESYKIQEFKKITGYLYDSYFAYRFLYKLRNYSLHCGLPIDDIELSVTKVGENSFRPEYKVEFDARELLANYAEWGPVKSDLKKMDKFSVFEVTNDMFPILTELWQKIMQLFEPELKEAISYITKETGHLRTDHNHVSIFTNIIYENDSPRYFTNQIIPYDIIDSILSELNSK